MIRRTVERKLDIYKMPNYHPIDYLLVVTRKKQLSNEGSWCHSSKLIDFNIIKNVTTRYYKPPDVRHFDLSSNA